MITEEQAAQLNKITRQEILERAKTKHYREIANERQAIQKIAQSGEMEILEQLIAAMPDIFGPMDPVAHLQEYYWDPKIVITLRVASFRDVEVPFEWLINLNLAPGKNHTDVANKMRTYRFGKHLRFDVHLNDKASCRLVGTGKFTKFVPPQEVMELVCDDVQAQATTFKEG